MTNKELEEKVSLRTGFEEEIVSKVIGNTFWEIGDAVARHETVKIINFGVFEPRLHTGRNTRNPRTGEEVFTEPFARIWFRSSRELKNKIRAGKG